MLDYIVIQDRSTFRVCLLLFFPHGNKWSEGIKLTNADIFVPFAKVSKYRMKQPKTKSFSHLENWDPISHKKHFYQFYKNCVAVYRWIHPHITSIWYVISPAQFFAWICFHVKKSWNRVLKLSLNLISRKNHNVKFLQLSTVSKFRKFSPTAKIFRQIDLQYNPLVKKLIWRNFCKILWGKNLQILDKLYSQ